jgi:hypothetical protein
MAAPGPINLANATDSTPTPAPVGDPLAASGPSSLANPKDATPTTAPVRDLPLPAIQRAGVKLTWGVLWLITVFVFVMVAYLWIAEPSSGLSKPDSIVVADSVALRLRAQLDTLGYRVHAADQTAFRDFWLKVMQMILLNVLLPVLTALLGYVFATQTQAQARSTADSGQ